jgi:cytochrome P450
MSNFMIDEKEFPEPHVFKPERWLENTELQKSKYFAPFGVGPRICAGRYLAESESRLLVASFVQRFSFTPYDSKPIPYAEGMISRTRRLFGRI